MKTFYKICIALAILQIIGFGIWLLPSLRPALGHADALFYFLLRFVILIVQLVVSLALTLVLIWLKYKKGFNQSILLFVLLTAVAIILNLASIYSWFY